MEIRRLSFLSFLSFADSLALQLLVISTRPTLWKGLPEEFGTKEVPRAPKVSSVFLASLYASSHPAHCHHTRLRDSIGRSNERQWWRNLSLPCFSPKWFEKQKRQIFVIGHGTKVIYRKCDVTSGLKSSKSGGRRLKKTLKPEKSTRVTAKWLGSFLLLEEHYRDFGGIAALPDLVRASWKPNLASAERRRKTGLVS